MHCGESSWMNAMAFSGMTSLKLPSRHTVFAKSPGIRDRQVFFRRCTAHAFRLRARRLSRPPDSSHRSVSAPHHAGRHHLACGQSASCQQRAVRIIIPNDWQREVPYPTSSLYTGYRYSGQTGHRRGCRQKPTAVRGTSRRFTRICIPYLGRRVTRGCITTG